MESTDTIKGTADRMVDSLTASQLIVAQRLFENIASLSDMRKACGADPDEAFLVSTWDMWDAINGAIKSRVTKAVNATN